MARRLLAQFCSAETMTRIVDPTLADARFEDGRLTWRGCLTLVRALGAHAVVSAPGFVARSWRDDQHAVPRFLALSLSTAVVTALPFVMVPFLGTLRNAFMEERVAGVVPRAAHTVQMFLLLMPQALAITVPAAL